MNGQCVSKQLAQKLLRSLGFFRTLVGLFYPGEVQSWQQLSKWMYEYGISRVQWRILLREEEILFTNYSCSKHFNSSQLIFGVADCKDTFKIERFKSSPQRKFTNRNYLSVWLMRGRLFQLRDRSKKCRLVQVNHASQDFSVQDLPDALTERRVPCLVNLGESRVLVIGGLNHSSSELIDIKQKKWRSINATLYSDRGNASACKLGDFIYLISRCTVNTQIERLKVSAALDPANQSTWQHVAQLNK